MAAEVRLDTSSTARESSERRSGSSEQCQQGIDSAERNEKGDTIVPLERAPTRVKEIWKFRLRPADDDEPQ